MDYINFDYTPNQAHRIIAISSQKGGVGKSTTTINVAAYLCKFGYKTLIIDMDPQSNSTSGVGIDYNSIDLSIYDILVSNENPNEVTLDTGFKNLNILPSNWKLSDIKNDIVNLNGREFRLKDAIEKLEIEYDFILIDCPASLDLLTINAMTASKEVIIPMQCEFYALEGISRLIDLFNSIKSRFNSDLKITGIVLTMYNRTRLANQTIREINRYFPDKVFNTIIPKNVSLAEAPSMGKPVLFYDPGCKGAIAYRKLTKEIIEGNNRIEKKEISILPRRFLDFWDTGAPPRHAK